MGFSSVSHILWEELLLRGKMLKSLFLFLAILAGLCFCEEVNLSELQPDLTIVGKDVDSLVLDTLGNLLIFPTKTLVFTLFFEWQKM